MKINWIDVFWNANDWIIDTTIEATSSLFINVGSVACMAGGAGYPVSYTLNKTLTASYFASLQAAGDVTISLDVNNSNPHFSSTLNLQDDREKNGAFEYFLNEFINPETVRMTSSILICSGVVLGLIGSNLKLWQQSRCDLRENQHNGTTKLKGPSSKEYQYTTIASLFASASYVTTSYAIAGAVMRYTEFSTLHREYTYPDEGEPQDAGKFYKGPVVTSSFPLIFQWSKQISFEIPFLGTEIVEDNNISADGTVNASYGGGLFVESHDISIARVAIPSAIGVSAHIIGNFFTKKLDIARDQRISEANRFRGLALQHESSEASEIPSEPLTPSVRNTAILM